jgi:hypothetical protein
MPQSEFEKGLATSKGWANREGKGFRAGVEKTDRAAVDVLAMLQTIITQTDLEGTKQRLRAVVADLGIEERLGPDLEAPHLWKLWWLDDTNETELHFSHSGQ